MKRNLTFEIKRVFPDYNVVMPKELEKRIGTAFKLIGDIKVGSKLEMHFEDGFIFKTSTLDIEGYINEYDAEDNLKQVTLLTKDIAYELGLIEKKMNIKLIEQLELF